MADRIGPLSTNKVSQRQPGAATRFVAKREATKEDLDAHG